MSVKHIHGGDVFGAAQDLGISQSEILDFSANINPAGPPPAVYDVIKNNMHLIVHYPDPHCRKLKKALSGYLGIPGEYILPGNGVAELIYILVRILGSRRAIIPVPTFTEYAIAVITTGGEVIEIPMALGSEVRLEVEAITSRMSRGDIIFLCNPNNPTGNLYSRDKLLHILNKAESAGAYLVVDEAFIDFVEKSEDYSLIKKAAEKENLFVFYSLTKFFALPGLRLGTMIGPPGVIDKMTEAKDPWNVNIFAQLGGEAALQDGDYIIKTRRVVKQEREYLYNRLLELPGIYPYAGEANFIFADISAAGLTCGEFTERMARRGVLVRDCSSFSGLGERHVRLAVKSREENRRLVEEISVILGRSE